MAATKPERPKRTPEYVERRRRRVEEHLARRAEERKWVKPAENPYWRQEILTTSPVDCVVKLYDGAIGFLRKAIDAIEANDSAARHHANRRACDIIEHLHGTLDMEKGGEIAQTLDRLYPVCLQRMVDIDVRNDAQAARDVIALLEPIRDSWKELSRRQAAEDAERAGRPNTFDSNATSAPGEGPRISASV